MKNRILLTLLSVALLLSSCMKDLGNYDYKEISDFEITGVEKNYSVILLENLKIPASITSNSGDYSYAWFIELADLSSGFSDATYADTISRELVLDIPFKYAPGNYTLNLKVTNNETGVAKYAQTTVSGVTKFSKGYYMLKETSDGNTEMDLHYIDGGMAENIITNVTGSPLQGKPKTLSYLNDFSYLNEETGEKDINFLMIPLSEQGMLTFNMTDMSIARNYENWYYGDALAVNKISHMANFGFCYGMFTTEGLFSNYQNALYGMLSVGKYANSADIMYDGTAIYSCGPHVCHFGYDNYCYDAVNNQIIDVDYNGGVSPIYFQNPPLMQGQSATAETIKDNVVYMGGICGLNDDNVVIVCEREDKTRYWYYASAEIQNYSAEMNIVYKADFEADSPFQTADKFATCRLNGTYLYTISNNEIYALNPTNGYSTKLEFPSMPAGEITYMDTMWYETYDPETSFNYFVLATYSNGNYTVALYDMIGGEPVKDKEPVKVLTGKGKIKSIQHADPGKQGNVWSETTYSVHY